MLVSPWIPRLWPPTIGFIPAGSIVWLVPVGLTGTFTSFASFGVPKLRFIVDLRFGGQLDLGELRVGDFLGDEVMVEG